MVLFKFACARGGIKFVNNTAYGFIVKLREDKVMPSVHIMVEELYKAIPEFEKESDKKNDDRSYLVYGDLSGILEKDIIDHDEITPFTIKCFDFFNKIGDRNNDEIDNLLIVGIYEALYSKKKCNDVARKLLKGRNKDVYEYWMKNGLIKSDY